MKLKQAMICAGLVLVTAGNASASLYNFSGSGGSIPDNQPNSGLLSLITVSPGSFTSEFGSNPIWVNNVNSVGFTITGGWNGDYKIVLTHLSLSLVQQGTAVLLDRMGVTVTPSHPNGLANGGMTGILLDDTAGTAIDAATGSSYTPGAAALASGTYKPQGGVNFNDFEGVSDSPLGIWALYITDNSGGDIGNLTGWSLNLEVVPEPITWALISFGVLFGAVQLRRFLRPGTT